MYTYILFFNYQARFFHSLSHTHTHLLLSLISEKIQNFRLENGVSTDTRTKRRIDTRERTEGEDKRSITRERETEKKNALPLSVPRFATPP